MNLEKWVKGAAAGTAMAGAVGATEVPQAEAGFQPKSEFKNELACTDRTAEGVEIMTPDGQRLLLSIPKPGEITSGQLPDGTLWEYRDVNGKRWFEIWNKSGGHDQKISIDCEPLS